MSASPERLWNRSFILCLLNNLFLFVYYFALLTILPVYIMKDLSGSVKEAGLALTLFLVSSIAIRPFSGMIIEKLGKKLAMRGAGVIFALFSFGYLLVDSMWSLLAVRFLHGIWFSILTTVTVPVANEFIPESRKGEGMGYFVMSTNLGVVFGPLLALTVVQFTSFKVLFGLLAVIISIGLIFSFMLKITELAKPQATVVEKSKFSLHDIIEVKVLAVSFVALLTAFAYSSIMSFITPFSETKQLLAYTGIFFIVLRPQCCWYGLGWAKFTTVRTKCSYLSFLYFLCDWHDDCQCHVQPMDYVVVCGIYRNWLRFIISMFTNSGDSICRKTAYGPCNFYLFTLFDIGLAVGSVVMGMIIAQYGFEKTYMFCAVMVIFTLLIYRQYVARKRPSISASLPEE